MQTAVQRRFLTWAIVSVVIASVTASGVAVAYHITAPTEAILRGVYIAGAHVGQLTPQQARQHIGNYVNSFVDLPITVSVGQEEWSVPAHELGVRLQLEDMLAYAYAIGRQGPSWQQLADRFRAARHGVTIPIFIDVDEQKLNRWLDDVAAGVEREAQDARIEALGQRVEVIPSVTGYHLNRQGVSHRVRDAATRPGRRRVHLPLTEIPPKFSTADAHALGISHPMGSYTTHFDPTDHNRTENIRIAARVLDGMVLAPGEEFSFNKRVGPRIESEGYKEAPVIIDGELVPDIGGGVCQVTSTLYNAVLLADLEVAYRKAHSIPTNYVPLGCDAAVAYDYIDFKFVNSSPHYVLIRAWVHHNSITLSFYGQASPFDRVRIESEIVDVIEPGVVERISPALASDERRILREGRRGYNVQVWRITDRAGDSEERSLVSRSFYRPADQIVLVGPPAEG